MSKELTSDVEFNDAFDKDQTWFITQFKYLLNIYKNLEVWTQLSVATTGLELAFSKVPLISIPNSILDVGGGLGNLFEKINSKDVMPSDVAGLANSFMTFVGAFSISASLGIETTLIGAKLIRIATLTTPVSIGLFALGYILDHHKEIKEYMSNEAYELLKEQYAIAVNKFEETKDALKTHMGEPLFDAVNDINQANIDKILITEKNENLAYNFDYLDPVGSLNLKDKLEVSPSDLYKDLNKLNTKANTEVVLKSEQNFELNNINPSANPFLGETEIKQFEPEIPPQDLFLSLDMSSTNLELIHLTKDDLKNSHLYTVKSSQGMTSYSNKDLPWLHENIYILEVNGKFFLYNHYGINKGLAFPLFFDKTTKLPIGLPLDINGDFTEMDALKVLEHSPHLFNEPGHIFNNMALAVYEMQHIAAQTAFMHSNIGMNAVQDRLATFKKININEIIKLKNDALETFNKNLSDHEKILNENKATLSTSSGNWREGKYCFGYNGINTSPVEEYLGDESKIIVEMCFDKNPYSLGE